MILNSLLLYPRVSSSRRASPSWARHRCVVEISFSLVCQARLCFRAHDRHQMDSGYNVPSTLDGDPVWLSLAGSARWRRREMGIGTRGKAVVQPVSLPSSRNQKRGEGCLVLRLVSWCPGCVGAPGLWSSVPVLFLGLVPLCRSGPPWSSFFVPGCVSKKRQRPRAPTQRPGFPTDRPRAERALGGGRERGATTRGPIFWRVLSMIYLAVGFAVGTYFGLYRVLFFLRLFFFRSSVQTHRRGAGGRTSTSRARSLRGSCLSFSRGPHAPRHRLSHVTTVIAEGDARAQVVPVEAGVSPNCLPVSVGSAPRF